MPGTLRWIAGAALILFASAAIGHVSAASQGPQMPNIISAAPDPNRVCYFSGTWHEENTGPITQPGSSAHLEWHGTKDVILSGSAKCMVWPDYRFPNEYWEAQEIPDSTLTYNYKLEETWDQGRFQNRQETASYKGPIFFDEGLPKNGIITRINLNLFPDHDVQANVTTEDEKGKYYSTEPVAAPSQEFPDGCTVKNNNIKYTIQCSKVVTDGPSTVTDNFHLDITSETTAGKPNPDEDNPASIFARLKKIEEAAQAALNKLEELAPLPIPHFGGQQNEGSGD